MLRTLTLSFVAVLACAGPGYGQVVISQYYEGTATNKWIELFNAGPSTVDLSTLAIGLWQNANAEGYKTDTAPSASVTLTGSLASGSVYVLGNTANTTPSYATANATSNSVINFNGNDSFAIYTAGTFATANIMDAVGFTNGGNEGADRSFVRTTLSAGYDTTSGSNVTSFSGTWSEVTLATVNSAGAGTNERIGFSTLTPVPEPTTVLGLAVGGLGLLRLRRRLV